MVMERYFFVFFHATQQIDSKFDMSYNNSCKTSQKTKPNLTSAIYNRFLKLMSLVRNILQLD